MLDPKRKRDKKRRPSSLPMMRPIDMSISGENMCSWSGDVILSFMDTTARDTRTAMAMRHIPKSDSSCRI